MQSDPRDSLDRILDDALPGYSKVDPRPGMEQRVLNRIRAESAKPRFAIPRWAWASSAVACLLLTAVTLWMQRVSRQEPLPAKTATVPAKPLSPSPARLNQGPRIARRSVRGRPSLPKLKEFPAPAPLTNEERAWLVFVARAPRQAREAFLNADQDDTLPVRIQEIRIDPLEIDSLQ
jgi:hypothetical protein